MPDRLSSAFPFLWVPAFVLLTACTLVAERNSRTADAPSSAPNGALPDELLRQVNHYRRQGCRCGGRRMPPVAPLQWDDQLEAAALRHARDMAQHDHFSHTGTDGSSSSDRATAAGYQWQAIGENIAWGAFDAASVVKTWIDSPGHCRNIMNAEYQEMGVAWEGRYWSQVLGRWRE